MPYSIFVVFSPFAIWIFSRKKIAAYISGADSKKIDKAAESIKALISFEAIKGIDQEELSQLIEQHKDCIEQNLWQN